MEDRKKVSHKMSRLSRGVGQEVILDYIYEHPHTELTVRDLAKKTKLGKSSVQRHLNRLKREGIIGSDYRFLDTWKNKLKKSQFNVNNLVDSGLIEFLAKELVASTIILFGSFSKGDSVKESDIDLFVECAKVKDLPLQKYEKILGHKIQLFTRNNITQLPIHLLNNVVNGTKLWGHFIVK